VKYLFMLLSLVLYASVASELKKGIKDYVGVSAIIEVCKPGEVARSEGKAVRVIDERDN